MRVLFVTTHTYLPQRAGGSESSTHDLAWEFSKRGHSVAVLAELAAHDTVWIKNRILSKITRKKIPADQWQPYRIYRGYGVLNNIDEVFSSFDPAVVIAQAGQTLPFLYAATAAGRKTILYLRDVDFKALGDTNDLKSITRIVANSNFVASKFEKEFGIAVEAIPPLIRPEAYKVNTTKKYCTFINPVRQKGVEIAFALAELNPDIRFQFVEGWPLTKEQLNALTRRLSVLPNVEFKRSTHDMRQIYATTKVLLVPSTCEEAWGRVVTEAQISGIPVLASNLGGLPQSVGRGGVLVDPSEDIEQWSQSLRKIFLNDAEFHRLSELATQRANEMDISVPHIRERFEKFVHDACV